MVARKLWNRIASYVQQFDSDIAFAAGVNVQLQTPVVSFVFISASSEESVGEFRFGKCAEIVIECGFVGLLGAESVGFSGDQF